MSCPPRILIVDDEPSAIELLEMHLTEKNFVVDSALDGKSFVEQVVSFRPEIVILDVRLPDADGLDLLSRIQRNGDSPQVIVVTAFHDMATTIKSIKLGAFEYIPKPIDLDDLDGAIERALDLIRTLPKNDVMVIPAVDRLETWEIVGKTKEMKEIFKTIGILSNNRVTVLIEGETGTGKELAARAIHYHSPYKDEPWIAINCSAIVENLLESELFGHEKGAFTGAVTLKKGKFEIAGNGTILLDEICEMPIELQAKLLRFIQNKEFQRVGGEKTLSSNARVLACTNKNLLEMVKKGIFREDLYYRLNVATMKMPALRDRKDDIALLVKYLLCKINRGLGRNVDRVESRALQRIEEYNWPGNVRELENFLTRAVIHTRGAVILDKVVANLLRKSEATSVKELSNTAPSPDRRQQVERDYILNVLQTTQWHYGNACKILGMSYPTLKKRIKEYGILSKPHKQSPR